MGAVASVAIALGGAILGLVNGLRSGAPQQNPTHCAIEEAARLQREKEELEKAAQAATEEAERLVREAEAAQAEAERIKREAEEARIAAEHAAQTQREEAQRREEGLKEEARKAAEAAEREVKRQQQLAAEQKRRAEEAQRAADAAARAAEEEARHALAAKEEAERKLREGIRPVIMPSPADLEEAKRRIGYREGLYHFAVVGIAGSGKSSLINAFRALRNRDSGAARTGVAETTLEITRIPDPNAKNPIVWYDVPGAGTLAVSDWQYFHDQGLFVFDALIVLFDNRFTATDVAILRNARLFNIPCYIVRSKADMHVDNLMKEMGYDADDDVETRGKLEKEARKEFIGATQKTVRENLRTAELPDQRVYIVSNSTILNAVKGTMTSKGLKKVFDEMELLKDFLGDALQRRGSSKAKAVAGLLPV